MCYCKVSLVQITPGHMALPRPGYELAWAHSVASCHYLFMVTQRKQYVRLLKTHRES
jgi:hypothetical protein